MSFPNRLSSDQVGDLDKDISIDEIRKAVWDCGESKSPGPDGFTFEFFRRYWHFIGLDFYATVNCFFDKGRFSRGSNSSFVALIPKMALFILNEVLSWCKRRRKQALVFKVDFAKAYDSVRWDFLLDVLLAFGFGPKWCQWIRGIFSSNMASILINGSPSSEFPIFSGLKQGDLLSPFLFILIMESLQLSVTRAVNDGIFKGLRISGSSSLSHLFYAGDAVFIGEWSIEILDNLLKILNYFHLASGLCINVNKSHVLGVGVPLDIVRQGALRIGCEFMQTPFKYLGVMVGDHMSRYSAWSNTIQKVYGRLSRWKVKTLSIGGRLTLLKSVLGADSKITWVAWANVLSSKKNRGLGVSSFFALNRALLLKWVWRYLVQDGSLWYHIISAIYGSRLECHSRNTLSPWGVILREVHRLASKGFNFHSHCKIRLFALELDKDISVAAKWSAPSFDASFRRHVRDGVERNQWSALLHMLGTITLSSSPDRYFCDLNGDGAYRVKDNRYELDDLFLPSSAVATRWVNLVPIKVNIFA
nr:RNA-directed DNA polymerase, eukaryota [Tanacetum cinerariifolium]